MTEPTAPGLSTRGEDEWLDVAREFCSTPAETDRAAEILDGALRATLDELARA